MLPAERGEGGRDKERMRERERERENTVEIVLFERRLKDERDDCLGMRREAVSL